MSAERVLTQRELNRAVLARQLLLERVKLPIPRALERICGIQNQYAPNGYIRLWSCLEGFERDELTRALERRTVVQATLMRATIHLVSKRDYWPFMAAIRDAQREWWLKVQRPRRTAADMQKVAHKLRERLREGPLHQKEIANVTGRAWGPWLDLVRVPPSGTWEQRRANVFAAAEDWVGPEDPGDVLEHLVKRYLGAFGPATAKNIMSFTGVPPAYLKPVLGRLKLRMFRDETGNELLDAPRAALPDPETPAPPRFLPTFDALLLVHARRAGIIEEKYRKIIFKTTAPQSFPTFLVDGRVAGTWKFDKDRIVLDPFERIPPAVRRELDEERPSGSPRSTPEVTRVLRARRVQDIFVRVT
jgi:winged helix DNA-binding protein